MSMNNDRKLFHTRQIACRAFRLENGFMEIEATLTDEKGQEVPFRSRPPVRAGELMHRMSLSLTIDGDGVLQKVKVDTQQAPWPDCGGTDAAYLSLIGLRIGPSFLRQVRERLGGTQGCTHVNDLVAQAANIYMQASWPDRVARQMAIDQDPRRWPDKTTLTFVDQCHAWRLDGDALAQEYPELVPMPPNK